MKRNQDNSKEILIIPLGKVMVDILNEITVALRKTYTCYVKLGRSEEPPTDCYSDQRRQYDAEKLITMLEQRKNPRLLAVIGVVDADIFLGEKAFVFGVNKPSSGAGLLSLTRLRPDYYGKPADIEKVMQRAVKEAIYHAALAAGIKNCPQKKCILAPGTALWRLDEKSPRFCESCRKKIEEKVLNRKKIAVDENLRNEGPEAQPQVMESEKPSARDVVDDESQIAAEIVEPEGPASAEEEAFNPEEQKADEPLDAGTQE